MTVAFNSTSGTFSFLLEVIYTNLCSFSKICFLIVTKILHEDFCLHLNDVGASTIRSLFRIWRLSETKL